MFGAKADTFCFFRVRMKKPTLRPFVKLNEIPIDIMPDNFHFV